MVKSLKEYLGLPTIRVGGLDSIHPMNSLGKMDDRPPKGKGSRDSRAMGLQANYTSQGVGSIKPMLSASKKSDELEHMKLMTKALKTMPGSQKQSEIKKQINVIRKRLGLRPISEDTKRIPRKKGQPAGSDKHSDLYTDENPKGTIHGLGFTDAKTAKTSVNKIKGSGKTHAHKMQAAIAMSQRAKVASQRAKDPEKKKNLGAAHKVYQSYIDTNKKKD